MSAAPIAEAVADLEGKRGSRYDIPFSFTQAGAPLDLTLYSGFRMVLHDFLAGVDLELTVDSGLTVNAAAGIIQPDITEAQTAQAPGERRWYLQWADPAGRVRFPLGGAITFSDP